MSTAAVLGKAPRTLFWRNLKTLAGNYRFRDDRSGLSMSTQAVSQIGKLRRRPKTSEPADAMRSGAAVDRLGASAPYPRSPSPRPIEKYSKQKINRSPS